MKTIKDVNKEIQVKYAGKYNVEYAENIGNSVTVLHTECGNVSIVSVKALLNGYKCPCKKQKRTVLQMDYEGFKQMKKDKAQYDKQMKDFLGE